jgi:hypothetical protein
MAPSPAPSPPKGRGERGVLIGSGRLVKVRKKEKFLTKLKIYGIILPYNFGEVKR